MLSFIQEIRLIFLVFGGHLGFWRPSLIAQGCQTGINQILNQNDRTYQNIQKKIL